MRNEKGLAVDKLKSRLLKARTVDSMKNKPVDATTKPRKLSSGAGGQSVNWTVHNLPQSATAGSRFFVSGVTAKPTLDTLRILEDTEPAADERPNDGAKVVEDGARYVTCYSYAPNVTLRSGTACASGGTEGGIGEARRESSGLLVNGDLERRRASGGGQVRLDTGRCAGRCASHHPQPYSYGHGLDKPATATRGVGQFAGRLSSLDSANSNGITEPAGRLSRDGVSQAPRTRIGDAPACNTFDTPRCFVAGEAGQRHKRTGRTAGGTPPVKAPWGVAAAGRVAAKNGSALFASASVQTEGSLSGLIIPAPLVREGNQVAQALGGLQADSRGGRKPFAVRVAGNCLNNNAPLLVLATSAKHLPGRLQPRAATTFPGAQADSAATYLISLARPTEQRAGSFRNQQENL